MPNPTILSATDSARAVIVRSTARQRRRRALPPPPPLPEMRSPTIPRLDATSPLPVDTDIAASSASGPSSRTSTERIRS
jgi:hypothetical protein